MAANQDMERALLMTIGGLVVVRHAACVLAIAVGLLNLTGETRADPASAASQSPGDESLLPRSAGLVGKKRFRAGTQPPPSPQQIARWIESLDSDLFLVRERATRNLIGAGALAIDPLALAADGTSLERATRAVHVLLQLSESDDLPLANQALNQLAQLTNRPAERRLAEARLSRMREERAIAEIVRLGGVERRRYSVAGQNVAGHVLIGEKWQGGDEGLRWVRDLRRLQLLSIRGAAISDSGIAELKDLPSLVRIELFGTRVTKEGVAALQKVFPDVKIDHRGGALLGVQGLPNLARRAEIADVVKGSAADRAGLLPRDVVTDFNGEPVKNFDALTRFIAEFRPGDKATLTIERGGKTSTVEVTFGKWR
ncbi:MAG: S1C family serine protease [Pirellulales bacterium]